MSDRITDVHAIRDVVVRYCRGIDRLDFDLVRQAYHDDGIDHHTGFDGTADEYVSWVSKSLEYLSGTMHFIGNHHVDFVDQDAAISETYLMATHWGGPPGSGRRANFTTGARYVDSWSAVTVGGRSLSAGRCGSGPSGPVRGPGTAGTPRYPRR